MAVAVTIAIADAVDELGKVGNLGSLGQVAMVPAVSAVPAVPAVAITKRSKWGVKWRKFEWGDQDQDHLERQVMTGNRNCSSRSASSRNGERESKAQQKEEHRIGKHQTEKKTHRYFANVSMIADIGDCCCSCWRCR